MTGALTIALLGLWIVSDGPARWLMVEDPPARVDAAVVLAGDPQYERTRMGASLVLSGEARLLVLTGGDIGPGDSADSLQHMAVTLGVPADHILLEATSHNTREALLAIRSALEAQGVKSIAVVTSPYHQRRALWAARRAFPGLVVRSRPAQPSFFVPEGTWLDPARRRIVATEYCKLLYYVARGWA